MKIGILTYHRALNYGACLQAVATRLVMESLGHEVYYVDYWPKYHQKGYATFSWNTFWRGNYRYKIKYLLDIISYYPHIKQRKKFFKFFLDKYIYPYCKPLNERYDAVLYGSDQIWRKQSLHNDYNPIYFGLNNIPTKMHIAFSASMGFLPQSPSEKSRIKELVGHLDKIAVRERDLKELLDSLGVENVRQTLDPTLLLDSSVWDAIIPKTEESNSNYVLVYALHPDVFNMQEIQNYAVKRNLQVKVLYGDAKHQKTKDVITTAGPQSFIQLIKNADFVFTSSFHGLAFSIIYKKQFYTSFKDNSNRAQTLLLSLGLQDRFLLPGAHIPDNAILIDYSRVSKSLTPLKEYTLDYLKSI